MSAVFSPEAGQDSDRSEDGFNIVFDYRFDSSGFFDNAEARAALEYAGSIWEGYIRDDFANIPAGTGFSIRDPSDHSREVEVITGAEIDDLLIFVGAESLESPILGTGGAAGFNVQGDIIRERVYGEYGGAANSDFEPFAGSISFDINTAWSFDISGPVADRQDLVSTALHEIEHVLGVSRWVSPFNILGTAEGFSGPNALAVNGGVPIPLQMNGADEGGSHVEDGFFDDMVLIDPTITPGVRKTPTIYDLAILADIGYEIDGYEKVGARRSIFTEGDDNPLRGTILADNVDLLGGMTGSLVRPGMTRLSVVAGSTR